MSRSLLLKLSLEPLYCYYPMMDIVLRTELVPDLKLYAKTRGGNEDKIEMSIAILEGVIQDCIHISKEEYECH